MNDTLIQNFKTSGRLPFAAPMRDAEDFLCECMMVSKSQIQDLIHQGVKDAATLSTKTGACTVCAGCTYRVKEMLGTTPLISCTMEKIADHNPDIRSYQLTPLYSHFKSFTPGQHITLQVQVGPYYLERPYIISDILANKLSITVERKPYGIFSNWLFDHAPENFLVLSTQPQGKFHLNPDEKISAFCIASDIGITPFITFVKALASGNSQKHLHILYCAQRKADFVFTDLFKTVTQVFPNISLQYWAADEQGPIKKDTILSAVSKLENPEIYLCGSESFEHFVFKTLTSNHFTREKIHIEHFFPVGI